MVAKLSTSYEVGDGEITLTIVIGNAQLGSSLVRLDGEEIGRGKIDNLLLGVGPDIVGKTLSIKSVITDVNDKTNLTSIRYVLKGGKVDKDYDLNATVDEEGASIIYRAKFELQS